MSPDEQVVYVHSVAEAYLYLKVAPCPRCRQGALKEKSDLTKTASAAGGWTLPTVCGKCEEETVLHFCINPPPTRAQAGSPLINPTAQQSSAIDLLGWLTLFQAILDASQKETNKAAGRELAYEAALCLDEALKFYEGENELPTDDAFFSETSLQRFREHPERFARSKWRERRLLLPDKKARTESADLLKPRPWWRFWR
jgi:hypothetical protein